MKTVRVSDLVFNGLREVADREGISMASVIDRMLTYSCNVCGGPLFPTEDESFRVFMKGKTEALATWGHKGCHEKE